MLERILAGLLGYLIGAVPTGLLVGRVLTGKDVRQQGSGHTGGMNVYRLAGLRGGVLTAIGDALLGAAVVAIAGWLTDDPWAATIAGVMAVVGHDWSVYIRFDGGIGLAKLAGAMFYLSFLPSLAAAIILLLLWLVVLVKVLRVHRARATIIAVVAVGPLLWVLGLSLPNILLATLAGVVVIVKTIPDWNRVYD